MTILKTPIPTELMAVDGDQRQSAQSYTDMEFRTVFRGMKSVEQRGDYRYGHSLPHLRPQIPWNEVRERFGDVLDPLPKRKPRPKRPVPEWLRGTARKTAGIAPHNPGSVALDDSPQENGNES